MNRKRASEIGEYGFICKLKKKRRKEFVIQCTAIWLLAAIMMCFLLRIRHFLYANGVVMVTTRVLHTSREAFAIDTFVYMLIRRCSAIRARSIHSFIHGSIDKCRVLLAPFLWVRFWKICEWCHK